MAESKELVGAPASDLNRDAVYVAVSDEIKESKSILVWAIQTLGKRICILHVHVPAQLSTSSIVGTKCLASTLKEQEVAAYREIERQKMHKHLDEHLLFCQSMGVQAKKLYLEMDCIEKGIVELISRYGIRNLVMGAASDRHYFRKMMDLLKSKKAIYVYEQAPPSCCIHFVCKGNLIHIRSAKMDGNPLEVTSRLLQGKTNSESRQPQPVRSLTAPILSNRLQLSNPAQDLFHFTRSIGGSMLFPVPSRDDTQVLSITDSRKYAEASSEESYGSSSASLSSFSTCSSGSVNEVTQDTNAINDGSDYLLGLSADLQRKVDLISSPPSVLDNSMDEILLDQLDQAQIEAETARMEAFRQSIRRGKAEKDAAEAMRRLKVSENFHDVELKLRKGVEQALNKEREELEKTKRQRDVVKAELEFALQHKLSLENKIAASERMVEELEQKIITAVDLLQNYKKERDELQIQHDNALREAAELRKQGEVSSTHVLQFFSEFSFSEIVEATRNFDSSLRIGEGGYGSIYRGSLRHTEVAIKILHSNSMQGPLEFKQEVDVLSKLRHPNLVTLIGTCPESWTLVYEYLPNGSLEDRLSCKDNSPPLSWQTRIRIATELCSALVFLQSCKPHGIVHGDLKPSNILLDANLVTKLSDFGICRVLSNYDDPSTKAAIFWRTDPKGTFVYLDPEFLASGELTLKSDVYSFGIILLRLLTGQPALGIMKEVQYALDSCELKNLLDPLAGDWPFVQAEQLTRLALRCCELNRKNRPDLASEVWRILEPMRAASGGASSSQLTSEEFCQPPPYFICPIFQEVMQDPHMAADGYTYEAEALRGWLESGHHTSPMTNLKLAHCNLIPNHALRSAIQEWLQHHRGN